MDIKIILNVILSLLSFKSFNSLNSNTYTGYI